MPYGVGALFVKACDSTNAQAATMALNGERGPIWIAAEQQSAGRGRRGRAWTSEPGNLYTSLLFRPSLAPADLSALPFLTALAIRDTFIDLGAPKASVQCKWPNDVLIGGKKASGVLIESSARSANALDHVIVGIGMNLLHHPEDAQFPATSLKAATGDDASPRQALSRLAQHMFDRLNRWNISDFKAIGDDWTECAWGLGERRLIRTSQEEFSGVPEALGADGGLIVRLDDGTEKRLYAGDIFPVSGLD